MVDLKGAEVEVAGEFRKIIANDRTSITVEYGWATGVAADAQYKITVADDIINLDDSGDTSGDDILMQYRQIEADTELSGIFGWCLTNSSRMNWASLLPKPGNS